MLGTQARGPCLLLCVPARRLAPSSGVKGTETDVCHVHGHANPLPDLRAGPSDTSSVRARALRR